MYKHRNYVTENFEDQKNSEMKKKKSTIGKKLKKKPSRVQQLEDKTIKKVMQRENQH